VEHMGYYLWEGITFLTILLVGTSLLTLRRKANGRPTFTEHDLQLFFGYPEVKVSKTRFFIHFGIAVFLFYLAGYLEYSLLRSFGAAILATAGLLTLLAVVKKWLC
jgi:hypothetical protein